jgi:hypothetical protein
MMSLSLLIDDACGSLMRPATSIVITNGVDFR